MCKEGLFAGILNQCIEINGKVHFEKNQSVAGISIRSSQHNSPVNSLLDQTKAPLNSLSTNRSVLTQTSDQILFTIIHQTVH